MQKRCKIFLVFMLLATTIHNCYNADITGLNPIVEEDMFWAYVEILGFLHKCADCPVRFFCQQCKENKLCKVCSTKPLCKKCSKKAT